MAPLLFREMKGTNYFSCASPSSLATCSSIHQTSILQPISSCREIDRHTPRLRDPHRSRTPRRNPKIEHRKSSAAEERPADPADPSRRLLNSSPTFGAVDDASFFDIIPGDPEPPAVHRLLAFEAPKSRCRTKAQCVRNNIETAVLRHSYSSGTQDHVQILPKSRHMRRHTEAAVFRPSSSSSSSSSFARPQDQCARSHLEGAILRPSSSTRAQDQVVVLRVSLHCKGCEGKVRRHIAKMQGVRSFEVDLATKKVTVAGDVTPLGVLNSISKVKHAQFWQSPPRASAWF